MARFMIVFVADLLYWLVNLLHLSFYYYLYPVIIIFVSFGDILG